MSQGHLTAHLTAPRTRSSTFLACCIGGLLFAVPPLEAADLLSGTWTSGEGADTLTYVFKVIGGQFTGISAGRVAQQNWILKVRDNRIWGLVCGPCTPAVVTMIDGLVAGDTITFNINHIDTPPDAARQGIQRNVMSGTIGTGDNANVMRFKWVSEGRPDRSGEIVMFGPLR